MKLCGVEVLRQTASGYHVASMDGGDVACDGAGLPKGSSYRLRGHGGPVSKEGYPNNGSTMYIREPGEHVIRYLIQRDPRDGRWNGSLHTQTGSVGKDHQSWVEWASRASTSGGVGASTRSYETDQQQVEIIRHRVSERANSSTNIENPAAGFMIWLEPI